VRQGMVHSNGRTPAPTMGVYPLRYWCPQPSSSSSLSRLSTHTRRSISSHAPGLALPRGTCRPYRWQRTRQPAPHCEAAARPAVTSGICAAAMAGG
jgi:hypothetical protein